MFSENDTRSSHFPICLSPGAIRGRLSSCELFGIDAYAEDDLGYAPS